MVCYNSNMEVKAEELNTLSEVKVEPPDNDLEHSGNFNNLKKQYFIH